MHRVRTPVSRILSILILMGCAPFGSASAQSADQQIVSVADSPDPVNRGQVLTYTVQTRNNGPGAAVNGGLNISLAVGLTVISTTATDGFSCNQLPNAVSCTIPQFAAGASANFTVVTRLDSNLSSFLNGQVSSSFFTSGVTPDPNAGNNLQVAQTVVLPDPLFDDGFESLR